MSIGELVQRVGLGMIDNFVLVPRVLLECRNSAACLAGPGLETGTTVAGEVERAS